MPRVRTFLTLSRAVLAVAGVGACAAALLVVAVRAGGTRIVRDVDNGGEWHLRSFGWFTIRGVFSAEYAPDGAAFAWAAGRVRVEIPR